MNRSSSTRHAGINLGDRAAAVLCAFGLLLGCGEKKEGPPPPNTELAELREGEAQSLSSYDIISKGQNQYQVPVDKALAAVAADPRLLAPLIELPDLDEMTPLQRGQYHFENTYACAGCHGLDGKVKKAPALNGRWRGPPSVMQDGLVVPFSDDYFKESVLYSQAKIVKGFQGIMPLFAGRMPDKDLLEIRTYLKSL